MTKKFPSGFNIDFISSKSAAVGCAGATFDLSGRFCFDKVFNVPQGFKII